jgi:Spy/CpxP family protein refolding chaperone
LLAAPALAQRGQGGRGGPGGGGAMFLLANEGVQKELKITDEQKDKLKAASEKFQADNKDEIAKLRDRNTPQEDRAEIRKKISEASAKALSGILKPEQEKRLKQIEMQQQGAFAFADPEVQKTLKLTDDQKDKIKTINEEAGKAMREAFQGGGGGRPSPEAAKKMADMRKETKEKIDAVLTPDQKKAWKDMTGEPFEMQRGRPGAGAGAAGERQPRRPRQGQ